MLAVGVGCLIIDVFERYLCDFGVPPGEEG